MVRVNLLSHRPDYISTTGNSFHLSYHPTLHRVEPTPLAQQSDALTTSPLSPRMDGRKDGWTDAWLDGWIEFDITFEQESA